MLSSYLHFFEQKHDNAYCQLLNGELHDRVVRLPISLGLKETGSTEMIEYLRLIHTYALSCPQSSIAHLDTHYATKLCSNNLYFKTYFDTDTLSNCDHNNIKNIISVRFKNDCAAFRSGMSWAQWLARALTQKPRKFG